MLTLGPPSGGLFLQTIDRDFVGGQVGVGIFRRSRAFAHGFWPVAQVVQGMTSLERLRPHPQAIPFPPQLVALYPETTALTDLVVSRDYDGLVGFEGRGSEVTACSVRGLRMRS